jgi:superfamily I DNA/RNA helicase
LDEAQDASKAQQDIISRCFQRHTRFIAFGDTDQTINSWCGSDIESIERILSNDDDKFRRIAKSMPLTVNYRCGKKIIEYAKRYSDKTGTPNEIKPHLNAPEGSVNFEKHLSDIQNNDMVLCRNTAPLMELYRRMVSNGQKVYFRGEELGKNLIDTVDNVGGFLMKEIILNTKRSLIAWWDFLTKETGLEPRETMTMPQIISMYDIIKTLEELPKSIENKDQLKLFVKDIFKNEGQEGIQLSTIHKAKGLEADNVFIICPSLLPSRLARTEAEIAEEKRLQYVMCTRPKESLNFVTEKDIRPNNAYSENNSFYEELMNIKKEITDEMYR